MRSIITAVFGSYIQDLPGDAMVPLIVGGYRHYVPTVVQACIEALYDIGQPQLV